MTTTNGKWTAAVEEDLNDPVQFWELPLDVQRELLDWISNNTRRAKRGERGRWRGTSYGAKHVFEHALGHRHYVSNGAAKQALLLAGFEPVDETKRNWTYRDLIMNATLEEAISP